MHQEFERLLNEASSITLVVDMWTSKNASDFIALGCVLMNHDFSRQLIILDMMKMTEAHTAEHVKFCVESMINKFEFDKSKINCKL